MADSKKRPHSDTSGDGDIIIHRPYTHKIRCSMPKSSVKTPPFPLLNESELHNIYTNKFETPISGKGVVVGSLTYKEYGDLIDCTKMGIGGKGIPPRSDVVDDVQSEALFILIVEKEAAYIRLAQSKIYNQVPCIIITAKGPPDFATLSFLWKLRLELDLHVLALVDSDPYSLNILSIYKMVVPDILWVGLKSSDFDKYQIPKKFTLPMTEQDLKNGLELLRMDLRPEWVQELEMMLKTKRKTDLKALCSSLTLTIFLRCTYSSNCKDKIGFDLLT